MDPTGPIRPNPPAPQPAGDSQPARWQVGQVLKAVALSNTHNGQTPLQIGRQLVQAQTPVPLQSGQQLSLQVQQLGEQPLLRIVSQLATNPVADAIRASLPRQDSVAPLLANLSQLAAARTASVPPLIQQVSRNLVNQLPTPQQVSDPGGLRQAVQNSGLFLEQRLTQGGSSALNIGSDFKANLLRLVQLVRNWPGADAGRPTTPQPPATPPGTPPGTGGTATPVPTTPPAAAPPPAGTPLPQGATGQPPAGSTPPLPQGQPAAGTPRPDGPGAGTVARGISASTPLPTGSGASAPATGQAATSTTATVTPGTLALPNPAVPPLRGQPPLPQAVAMAAANYQRLELTGMLRPEIQKQVEAALARVQLNQLASVPRDQDSGLEWLFELPVRRGNETDIWAIRIRRDTSQQGQDRERPAHTWSIQVAFDLPGLGPMQARVSMQGERISTWFWAQRDETLPFLREHLPDLRQGLEDAGLDVGEVACRKGFIPTRPADANDPGLLSEKV